MTFPDSSPIPIKIGTKLEVTDSTQSPPIIRQEEVVSITPRRKSLAGANLADVGTIIVPTGERGEMIGVVTSEHPLNVAVVSNIMNRITRRKISN